jgi:hypothetical protein
MTETTPRTAEQNAAEGRYPEFMTADCRGCTAVGGHYPECPRYAANLPAVPLGRIDLGSFVLEVDDMRRLAPVVRDRLVEELRASAAAFRKARGTVVVPEDVFELVRRVTAAQEVLTQWAQAFTAAARECTALLEEEALTANGGLPGYEEAPAGSLFVPDGTGQRIAVTPDWKPGGSTWDVDTLAAWIAETVVADEGRKPEPAMLAPGEEPSEVPVWTNEEAVSLCRDAIDKLRRLGTYTPGIKLLEAERKRLAGLGRDADAAVLRQVRSVGLRQYRGVRITREDAK